MFFAAAFQFIRPSRRHGRFLICLVALLLLEPSGNLLAQASQPVGVIADQVFTVAGRYLGVPYDLGGRSQRGIDCSGLVWSVYRRLFPSMPQSTWGLAKFGTRVPLDELQPGDLVFFATGPSKNVPTHVALYLGQQTLIHAVSNGWPTGVVLSAVSDPYWSEHFLFARRPPFSKTLMIWEAPNQEYSIPYLQGWYHGPIILGQPEGRGFFFFRNGDTYIGNFKNGLATGHGVYHWKTGAWFEGTFADGARDGPGILKLPGQPVVKANWHNDLPLGLAGQAITSSLPSQLLEAANKTHNQFLFDSSTTEAMRPRTPPS